MPKFVHHDGDKVRSCRQGCCLHRRKPVGQAVNFQFLPLREQRADTQKIRLSAHVTVNPSSAPFCIVLRGIEHAIEIEVLSGTRTDLMQDCLFLRWPPRRIPGLLK